MFLFIIIQIDELMQNISTIVEIFNCYYTQKFLLSHTVIYNSRNLQHLLYNVTLELLFVIYNSRNLQYSLYTLDYNFYHRSTIVKIFNCYYTNYLILGKHLSTIVEIYSIYYTMKWDNRSSLSTIVEIYSIYYTLTLV